MLGTARIYAVLGIMVFASGFAYTGYRVWESFLQGVRNDGARQCKGAIDDATQKLKSDHDVAMAEKQVIIDQQRADFEALRAADEAKLKVISQVQAAKHSEVDAAPAITADASGACRIPVELLKLFNRKISP